MSSSGCYYNLWVEPTERTSEVVKAFRDTCENARYRFDEDGSSDNDWYWADAEEELMEFSKLVPDVLLKMAVELTDDGHYECHHYAKNGKFLTIEPVITWPEFHEEDLE